MSCSNVEFVWNLEMLILEARLNSVHPSTSLVRRAVNMTNERKSPKTSVRLGLLGVRFKTP